MKQSKANFIPLFIYVAVVTILFVDRSSLPQSHKRYVLLSDEITRQNDVCDCECVKFRELMKNWPHGKPKAAVIILTYPNPFSYMQQGLRNLDMYFLNNFSYPIIIFHEMDYRPYINTVRTWTNASVFFQEIKFEIPSFLNMSKIPELIQNRPIGKIYIFSFSIHKCLQ